MRLKDTQVLSGIALGLFYLALVDGALWQYLMVGLIMVGLGLIDLKYRVVLSWCLLLIMCIFAQWALGQFIVQHDLGLRLVGESVLGKSISGVAKFGDNKLMRGYGPFEHANILGGLCVLALAIAGRVMHARTNRMVRNAVLFTLGLGVFVSFSRAAIISWLFLSIVLWVLNRQSYTGRTMILMFMMLVLVLFPLILQRTDDSNDAAIPERLRGYSWSVRLLTTNNVWFGLGFSDYKKELQEFLDRAEIHYEPWEIDYVHSVPLIVLAQFGVLGGGVIIAGFIMIISRMLSPISCILIGALLPIFLLDHFFITQPVAVTYFVVLVIVMMADKAYLLKRV